MSSIENTPKDIMAAVDSFIEDLLILKRQTNSYFHDRDIGNLHWKVGDLLQEYEETSFNDHLEMRTEIHRKLFKVESRIGKKILKIASDSEKPQELKKIINKALDYRTFWNQFSSNQIFNFLTNTDISEVFTSQTTLLEKIKNLLNQTDSVYFNINHYFDYYISNLFGHYFALKNASINSADPYQSHRINSSLESLKGATRDFINQVEHILINDSKLKEDYSNVVKPMLIKFLEIKPLSLPVIE